MSTERTTENDARPSWAEKHYAEPCDSCGARAGQPCRTRSGYVTMRHASRRRTTPIPAQRRRSVATERIGA